MMALPSRETLMMVIVLRVYTNSLSKRYNFAEAPSKIFLFSALACVTTNVQIAKMDEMIFSQR